MHANEGKNRFHGARERGGRFQISFQSPLPRRVALPRAKKMRIQRARNSHPTRTMKSNAHVSIERRNIQSKHLHSFLSNIYFASSRSLRANLIFSISRPQRPSSPFFSRSARARKSPVRGGGLTSRRERSSFSRIAKMKATKITSR